MDAVLACVDRTPIARRVLDTAARIAAGLRAQLCVLHVAPAEPEWVGWGPGPQTVRDAVARELRSAHREVQALAAGVRASGDVKATARMLRGPVAETILAQAEALDALFIVLGARRRSSLAERLTGSVTRRVLRRAMRPVIVVP